MTRYAVTSLVNHRGLQWAVVHYHTKYPDTQSTIVKVYDSRPAAIRAVNKLNLSRYNLAITPFATFD